MITFDDFKKVEIRAGKILSAEKIPNTDKLLKLSVDFGEKKEIVPVVVPVVSIDAPAAAPVVEPTATATSAPGIAAAPDQAAPKTFVPAPRQIISGISAYFPDPTILVGKTCMFVTNLEPRMIKGLESNGMLFALSDAAGNFSLLEPNASIAPGTQAI